MKKEQLSKLCGNASLKLVEAMKLIDENACGILFVLDGEERLVGVITDGDIRRWIIKTADLDVEISAFMNTKPKYVVDSDRKEAMLYMRELKIHALPIVDESMKILDIVLENDKYIEKEKKQTLSLVPVVIMAGGKGTRLYPYTSVLPKPLIPIDEIPIMERIINRFNEYGISKFYITVNYKKGLIKAYFDDLDTMYSIEYIEEDKPLGTGGSIKLIKENFDCPIIVTNCDILINADYEDIYRHHKESGNKMTIVSSLKNIEVPYGVLNSTENGIVTHMEEKPKLSYLINTGMYVIDSEMLKKIPEDTFFHMTDLADLLISEGLQVGMYPLSEDSYLDMGEFEEMSRMEDKLLAKKRRGK